MTANAFSNLLVNFDLARRPRPNPTPTLTLTLPQPQPFEGLEFGKGGPAAPPRVS